MTCKNCVHCDVCRYKFFHLSENHYTLDSKNVEYVCKCFKNKTKYIELPCKVGDTVYIIDPFNGICDTTLRNVRINNMLKNNIFLTKSEAEQKLKELKENAKID